MKAHPLKLLSAVSLGVHISSADYTDIHERRLVGDPCLTSAGLSITTTPVTDPDVYYYDGSYLTVNFSGAF